MLGMGRYSYEDKYSYVVVQQSEARGCCKGEIRRQVIAVTSSGLFIASDDRGHGRLASGAMRAA